MSANAIIPPEPAYTRYRLSVRDLERMREVGIFREEDRVELMNGEPIQVPPIGNAHAGAVNRIANRLAAAVVPRAIVSTQNPVQLDSLDLLRPDVALLRPRADYYAGSLPAATDILLICEVGEREAGYDRDLKLPLYARHRIPEVWLVDLPKRCLWRCADPSDLGYARINPVVDLRVLAPFALPDCVVNLAGLFS